MFVMRKSTAHVLCVGLLGPRGYRNMYAQALFVQCQYVGSVLGDFLSMTTLFWTHGHTCTSIAYSVSALAVPITLGALSHVV